MTDVRVNKSFIAENLTAADLEQGKELARDTLHRMNDRQFIEWLTERFPEAATGEVNIGVVTLGNVVYRFFYKDVSEIIRQELVARMGAPRLTKDMIGLPIRNLKGDRVTSVEFMQSALDEFKSVMKEGPEEPKVYFHHNNDAQVINSEWIDWYTNMYGVTRTEAWKVAAGKIGKEYGKDPKEFTAVPGPSNVYEVHFVRSIDQARLD